MAGSRAGQRLSRWFVAAVYTALLFTLAWYVSAMWRWLTQALGTEAAGNTVDIAVPLIGAVVLLLLILMLRVGRLGSYAWLFAVASGYAYLLTLYCEYPVERVHLIQYSLVAWVYFQALRLDTPDWTAYVGAACAVLVVGTADELIQHKYIEGRSGTLEDMITNWCAGGLGLVGLLALQKEGIWHWYGRRKAVLRFAVGYAVPLLVAGGLTHQVWTKYLYPPLNLMIITVDCARPDRMGIYGYERDTTPWLDKLAPDAAVFTNMYSQAAWTGPGVLSTLTGLYPHAHGVTAQGKTTPKSVYTILDAFKERGYRVPDVSYLTVDSNYKNLADMEETGIDVNTIDEVGAIRTWLSDNHRDPFAMWYHWRFAHLPYDPPKRHRKFPPASDPEAKPPEVITTVLQEEVIIPEGTVTFTEEDKPWIDSLYDAQIREFDSAFESLRYKLALHHKLDNTIIIITADHGEELLEHGHVGHASTSVHSKHYDEHLHIPLIIHCPQAIKQGRVIDTMAQQVDILPTVFEMMGWEIPEEAQGRSLLSAIQGEPMDDVSALAESVEGGYQAKQDMRNTFVRSVRTKEWKFIARMAPQGDTFELYNLVDDPGELNDVFIEYPAIAGGFIADLGEWITDNEEVRSTIAEKEQLLALRTAALDPANLEVPVILEPADGSTIYHETNSGAINARWTGNPHAAYIIEYDVGEGWHKLKGKYPVEVGTKQVFGPLPRDGWKPLYQWNPYRLRVRPRDLTDGWSEWITIDIAPLE